MRDHRSATQNLSRDDKIITRQVDDNIRVRRAADVHPPISEANDVRIPSTSAVANGQIPETMSAVVCHGPENYQLETVSVPVPGPSEAMIKVDAVGICGSDLKCYHGAAKFWGDESRPAWAETEVIPGHGIAVGDRVVSEQIVPCWKCRLPSG